MTAIIWCLCLPSFHGMEYILCNNVKLELRIRNDLESQYIPEIRVCLQHYEIALQIRVCLQHYEIALQPYSQVSNKCTGVNEPTSWQFCLNFDKPTYCNRHTGQHFFKNYDIIQGSNYRTEGQSDEIKQYQLKFLNQWFHQSLVRESI